MTYLTSAPTAVSGSAVATAWRTVHEASGGIAAGIAAATFLPLVGTASQTSASAQSATSGSAFRPYAFTAADHAVVGLTTTLRLRAYVGLNNIAPGTITFTVGVYPLTVAGTGGNVNYSLGTVISGSTVAFANPTQSVFAQSTSTAFAVPSNGFYALGVVSDAATAANSFTLWGGTLQVHNS
jgi:hypothetical protein